MSGKKARNILAGYKVTIIPFITLKGEKKNNVDSLLECMTVIQFLAYASYPILSDPKWRIQIWLYSFLERVLLKIVFGPKVKEAITLHTHGITGHLAPYTEKVVKDGRSPVQNSTEKFESKLANLNKQK